MPVRYRRSKRRSDVRVTPEAIALFKRGTRERDPCKLRDIKIGLAVALGRSKFSASPLDSEPRSLIAGDTEPVEVALRIREQMLKHLNLD